MNKRKKNPDHVRGRHLPSESNEVIEKRLNEWVKPAVFSQLGTIGNPVCASHPDLAADGSGGVEDEETVQGYL